MAELTPMKRQYYEIKQRNPDCLLFFRLAQAGIGDAIPRADAVDGGRNVPYCSRARMFSSSLRRASHCADDVTGVPSVMVSKSGMYMRVSSVIIVVQWHPRAFPAASDSGFPPCR